MAIVVPFPVQRGLSGEERALIDRWTRAARRRGITWVYVSARKPDDAPEVHDRILIVETPRVGASWVLVRPQRRWMLICGQTMQLRGEFAAIGDALEAIRPSLLQAVEPARQLVASE